MMKEGGGEITKKKKIKKSLVSPRRKIILSPRGEEIYKIKKPETDDEALLHWMNLDKDQICSKKKKTKKLKKIKR